MRRFYTILTLNALAIFLIPVSLTAQHYTNSSANITVTVLPAVGVELQEQVSLSGEKGSNQSKYSLKINDTGKYSLQIIDESNSSFMKVKALDENNSNYVNEKKVTPKKIIQVVILSS